MLKTTCKAIMVLEKEISNILLSGVLDEYNMFGNPTIANLNASRRFGLLKEWSTDLQNERSYDLQRR